APHLRRRDASRAHHRGSGRLLARTRSTRVSSCPDWLLLRQGVGRFVPHCAHFWKLDCRSIKAVALRQKARLLRRVQYGPSHLTSLPSSVVRGPPSVARAWCRRAYESCL